MNQFFLKMTVTQQVGALFVLVFGVLALLSMAVFVRSLREFPEGDAVGEARRLALKNAGSVLNASWVMMVVFWVAWAAGGAVATVLFGLVSFFTLREFITLSPTRRGDHRSLVLAFFVVLPVQFVLVGLRRFDLFTVFIPVYVFLLIPVVSALADDPQRFLERNAKLQWGIMVCVYGLSHVPALLLLDFPHKASFAGRNAFLVFFLVLTVQICMVVQHFASRALKAAPSAPHISQSFNWRSWMIGVAVAGLLAGLFAGITPFQPGQAMAMGLIAAASGSLGHLVMKALKRDRGVTNWGSEGKSITGTGGLLDRVDALCFAAPVFFHSVRWYFGLQ
jgi:phosphatidate cytidylyltransferase